MNIDTSLINGKVSVTVIHINGMIDSASFAEFETKINHLIGTGAHHILLDLTHTAYIGSAGMRIIHNTFRKLRAVHPHSDVSQDRAGMYKSPHIKLLNPAESIKAVLNLGGYDMYIDIFSDLKTAIAAFEAVH